MPVYIRNLSIDALSLLDVLIALSSGCRRLHGMFRLVRIERADVKWHLRVKCRFRFNSLYRFNHVFSLLLNGFLLWAATPAAQRSLFGVGVRSECQEDCQI